MDSTIHSEEYRRLTAWLKAQRESEGLSMRELGNRMGITHSFIGKIEQRERKLDVVEFVKYCKALGVSPVEALKTMDKKLL